MPIKWVEDVCALPKAWGLLKALPPSPRFAEAWEAQVHLVTEDWDHRRREPLWLRGHREQSGVIIVTLAAEGGVTVLRRGHIDGGHQEPDAGPFISGPHVHFPTSVFQDISSHGRSRVYPWSIGPTVTLKQAVLLFARELSVVGELEEEPLLGESDGL